MALSATLICEIFHRGMGKFSFSKGGTVSVLLIFIFFGVGGREVKSPPSEGIVATKWNALVKNLLISFCP